MKELTKKLSNLYGDGLKVGTEHLHTENSLDDSTLSCKKAAELLSQLGAKVGFISDHGTCMGWDDWRAACKTYGLKPIYGVEAYLLDNITGTRTHLVLYAKDMVGYHQICHAMSRAEVQETKGGVFTVFTDETLELLRGGHVIATSACIQGPFGAIILYNDRIKEKITALENDINDMADDVASYEDAKMTFEDINEQLAFAKSELSAAKKAAKTPFTGKLKSIESMKKKLAKAQAAFDKFLSDDKETSARSVRSALSALEINVSDSDMFEDGIDRAIAKVAQFESQIYSERDKVAEIAKTVPEKEAEVARLNEERATAKSAFEAAQKVVNKVEVKKTKIEELTKSLLSQAKAKEHVSERMAKMLDIFGNNFYMEVQYHGIPAEEKIYPWIAKLAKKHHLPLIAANDVHVGSNTEAALKSREIRRSCRFKKWEPMQVGDDQLYIKTDRELATALFQILSEDQVIEAMSNVEKIANECNVDVVKENHAPKAKIENVKDEVIRLARNNIKAKYGETWSQKHEDRFNYEIEIIDSMGFCDYFYITWDILNVARLIGALSYEDLDTLKAQMSAMSLNDFMEFFRTHKSYPNLSVGLGRGSGAGSIVCYLLGITNIDPFKYDLLFERFLNPERISMPDIDSDFRTDIKDVLLVYLKAKYGDRAIAQILTKSYLQGKSAIDKVIMILGDRDGIDYRSIGVKLKKKNGVDFDHKTLKENKEALLADCESAVEREIVETAVIMDGNLDHTGLHAAGCIISDNDDLAEYIPVAWDVGFQTWKTQCDMVQCENEHGLLKMDLLLLKTLDIITYTLRLLQKTHPNDKIDIENLPIEQKVIEAIYATGDTKSVFQFESGGMVKNLKSLQPKSIEDIIAMNAMYRPGPMDNIPTYIENKKSGKITYPCPQLEPILKETYGIIVYQEQVMQIVRDLAGYSIGRSDLVRRAMAKKHLDELVAERKNFVYGNPEEGIHGCLAIGISEKVANDIFDNMLSFASYAFNKAHAAAYSVTSYMTAWLKYYYPAEFYAAVLNFVGKIDEIPAIIADAHRHNIKVLPPDFNKSDVNFSVEKGNVRFGLAFLRGAKSRAQSIVDSRESGFPSFKAFVASKPGKAIAEACIMSGACDATIPGRNPNKRNALLTAYADLEKLFANVGKLQERLDAFESPNNAKAIDVKKQLDETNAAIAEYKLPDIPPMEMIERLQKERYYTSVYFSGNPLDNYNVTKDKYTNIDSLNIGDSKWIVGTISEEEILKTKRDARQMMSGKITDYTGTVDFIIFPQAYSQYAEILEQGTVAMRGNYSSKDDDEAQFIVNEVAPLTKKIHEPKIIVWFEPNKYNEVKKKLCAGHNKGSGVKYTCCMTGKNTPIYGVRNDKKAIVKVTEEYVKSLGFAYKID